jgi:hypothetical protein
LLKEDDGALVEGFAEEDRSSKKKVREDRDVLEFGRKNDFSEECFGTKGGIDMLSPRGKNGTLEHR